MNIDLTDVKIIDRRAFQKSNSLKSITLDKNYRKTSLSSKINIGEKDVEQLSKQDSISSIALSDNLLIVRGYAFSECNFLNSVELPSNVIIIGEKTFEKCKNLEKVNFSGTSSKLVGRKIEAGAFSFCSSLNTITLPNNLELIEEQAFLDCTALEQIEIPENVKEIKDRAFYGCESLKTVVIIAKEPPLLGEGVFPIEGISFEVPKESIEKYKNENCWFQYKGMIQEA
jgi:hypothetical protein